MQDSLDAVVKNRHAGFSEKDESDPMGLAYCQIWPYISSFCAQIASNVLRESHALTHLVGNLKRIPATCYQLGIPLYTPADRTHIRHDSTRVIVCTPVHFQYDRQCQSLMRLEFCQVLDDQLRIGAGVVSDTVYRQWNDNSFPDEIFSYLDLSPAIITSPDGMPKTVLDNIIRRCLSESSAYGPSLAIALMMSRWYQMTGYNESAGTWLPGPFIQLQGILSQTSGEHNQDVKIIQEELTKLCGYIEKNSFFGNNMDFISYSYIRMLLSGTPVDILNITDNMPKEYKRDFYNMINLSCYE